MSVYSIYRLRILFLVLGVILFFSGLTQRRIENINQGWLFTKDNLSITTPSDSIKWAWVNLPHTWNAEDVNDDVPGYYRAACWYKKALLIDESYKGKNIQLSFDGSNQVTEVYINGKKAGEHTGGYTAFNIKIDAFLNYGDGAENIVLVKVDNSYNENIPPLSADFTFYGGIYRDVNLIVTDKVFFSNADAATGVFISTPVVTTEKASVQIKLQLKNEEFKERKLELINELKDASGNIVKHIVTTINLQADSSISFSQVIENITKPHLWSTNDPYLYNLFTTLRDPETGNTIDAVVNSIGFKWFKFDPKRGFFLNGKPLKLIGASRHQDFNRLGNALSHSMHLNDVKMLKAMGGNFLRVAHYPQDQTILDACDRMGILVSVEIPVVNAITETEAFANNCKAMLKEMIRQNFNHTSIILWGYMNEVFLKPEFTNDPERQKVYFNSITKLAEQLDALARQEDSTRYTTIAHHGNYDLYKQYRLIDIPMVVGWNLYQGWYSDSLVDFGKFLDTYHHEFPNKPVMITEYGADVDPRIHSLTPERFDKSLEYALKFHQVYLKAIKDRPYVSAAMIWNLADFNSESREETMPHINNKGILTIERKPKDLYSFYQAHLLNTPYVKISNWRDRSGLADKSGNTSTQLLTVFSNANSVKLLFNGLPMKIESRNERVHTWRLPFKDGTNILTAIIEAGGKQYTDVAEIHMNVIPLKGFTAADDFYLNVLLGAKRMYTDELTGDIWIPSKEYTKGSWGHIGGEAFQQPGNSRQSYASDRNIKNTDNDPVYQSQQTGIQKFKCDVPDGEYEVSLFFAELTTNEIKESLAYNLDQAVNKTKADHRQFNITVNEQMLFKNFDVSKRYGFLTAGSERFKIVVNGGKGIEIQFTPVVGKPVLNAIQIKKIH